MMEEREGNIKGSNTSSEVHNIDTATVFEEQSWKEVLENPKERALWTTVTMKMVIICDSQKPAKVRTAFQE